MPRASQAPPTRVQPRPPDAARPDAPRTGHVPRRRRVHTPGRMGGADDRPGPGGPHDRRRHDRR
ncbi:hypothetical protein ACFSM7_03105 [Clavibacter michiganensis subsp. tessellarius]|uniref:hypothetical protein n=1 Tax=Clavibacter tessellarius TaxID=31965 RepID=UPI003643CCDD